MHLDTQVAIIGGGPAGSVCATALARRGIAVVLFEAREFPRPKVCGETLSPAVTTQLARYLPVESLRSAGAIRVDHLRIWANGRRVADWRMPRSAWSLSRATLDDLLLSRARDVGVQVHQGEAVQRVIYQEQGVLVGTQDREIAAHCVIHADGRGRFDDVGPTPNQRHIVGLKCYLRLGEPIENRLELMGFDLRGVGRGYFGIVGIEGGRATLAMAIDNTIVRRFSQDELLAMLAERFPTLQGAAREGDWLSCGVPESGYRTPGHPRSFRIGNAAAAVEPVGGEGIGLAIWSGDLLGQSLQLSGLTPSQDAMRCAYHRRLRWRRPVCRMGAAWLRRPTLLRPLRPILKPTPGLVLSPMYRLAGKLGQ